MELKHKELGNLKQIADGLWREMNQQIERHGHSNLTLHLEGAARGIYEIIEINQLTFSPLKEGEQE